MEITESNIDRLSQEDCDKFVKNYDLLKGRDLLGRVQYVLLNKDVIRGIGKE